MKVIEVTMLDGSVWTVPVHVVARNRAEHFAHEFCGSVTMSLAEDTEPLFESDSYEIEDWARNNMDWSDVVRLAVRKRDAKVDFQEGWVNGEMRIVDI